VAGQITVKKVRDFLQDRSKHDNPLKGDIFWEDHDVLVAMEVAAAAYNDLPPYHPDMMLDGSSLPATEWAYLAVQEALYQTTIARLKRNAFVYKAGGNTYDEDQEQIALFEKDLGRLVQWRSNASSQKRSRNFKDFYFDA
jgi:hypothetical protein